jgi:hypothetical protein
MAICPICHKPGKEADDVFCVDHGARLIAGNAVVAAPTPPAREPSSAPAPPPSTGELIPPDKSAADQLRAAHRDIAQRDARIAELEAAVATADRNLKALRAPAVPSEEADDDDQPTANDRRPDVAGTPEEENDSAESTDSTLAETEIVPPEPQIYGWLIGVGGVVAGERYAIGSDRIDIGRLKKFANGGIRINDKSVSNPHAFITVEHDTVMLHDEGSMNGTFLGNKESERITKVPLKDGVEVVFADRKVSVFVFKQT